MWKPEEYLGREHCDADPFLGHQIKVRFFFVLLRVSGDDWMIE